MCLRRQSRRAHRLARVIPLLWLGIGMGCASRRDQLETGGSSDERRQEIARLDQQIARAESELGLRPSRSHQSATAAAEPEADLSAGMGAEAGGEEMPTMTEASPSAPSPPPSAPMQQRQPPPSSPSQSRFAQPPGGGTSCAQVCRSVAAICDASGRICRLAEDLDDAWATGRCQAANRSCANAEQRVESSCGECD